MIGLLELLLRLWLLPASPEQWRLVDVEGKIRCTATAPALNPAERARLSYAWAWSDRAAPRRLEPGEIDHAPLPEDRARLAVSVAGWHRGRSGRLVAAPAAMWEELPEDLLPAWPVPASGRLKVPLDPGRGWRLRLIEAGTPPRGSWWLDLPPGRSSATLASTPAQGIEIAVAGADGRPVQEASLVLMESGQGRLGEPRRWARDEIEEGVLRLPGLPDAEAVVAVVLSEEWAPVVLTGMPGELPARLAMSLGARLSGRLVDGAGRPVTGASVHLEATLPRGAVGYQPSQADSGADGSWTLKGLPSGRAALLVLAPGFAPHRDLLDLAAGTTDLGRIELRRGTDLAVLVVDDLERPVAGAGIDAGPGLSAATDAQGRAELRGVDPLREVALAVGAPGHLRAAVVYRPGSPTPARVVLRRAFVVAGRLLGADGAPAAQGTVAWQTSHHRAGGALDPGGRFAVELEPDGAYELALASSSTPELRLTVQAGAAGEVRDLGDLRAPAASRVVGRVVAEADGTPVTGARVWLPRPSAAGPLVAWVSRDLLEARTGEDGRFRLAGLPAGPALLRIDAPGYARAHRAVQVVPGESAADLGEISVGEGATVRVLADRRAAGALARLDLRGDWLEADMLTADLRDGEARFRHVPPGPATLSVLREGKLLCERQLEIGPGSGDPGDLEVECRGAGLVLRGLVRVGGHPVGPGRLLWLAPTSMPSLVNNVTTPAGLALQQAFRAGRPQVDVEVAEDGTFATEDVAAGRWQVLWEPAGAAPGPAQSIEIPGVDEYEAVLDFAGTFVPGVVVDAEGAPVEGARVRSLAEGALALSRADGSFELWGLAPGRRTLQAQREELRSEVAQVEVPAERPADLVRLVLAERREPELTVQVTDTEGVPAAGAFVFLEEDGRPLRLLTAGADGVARAPVAEPVPARVRAAALAPGGWVFGDWTSWDTASAGLDLRLGAGSALAIESASRSGTPAIVTPRGWDLSLLLTSLGTRPELEPENPLVMPGLPAGTYTISLDAATATATLYEGKPGQVRLE